MGSEPTIDMKKYTFAAADNNIKHPILEFFSLFHTKNKSFSSSSKKSDFSSKGSNSIKYKQSNYKSNSVDNKKINSYKLLQKKDNNININYNKPLWNNYIDNYLMKFDDVKRNPIFVN